MTSLPEQSALLGIPLPKGIALLPINFGSAQSARELHYSNLTSDIERALVAGGIELEFTVSKDDPVYLETRSVDWILPVLAIGVAAGPHALSIALSIISNYLYDRLKRLGKSGTVRMQIVRSVGDDYERLEYEGPVDGLNALSAWRQFKPNDNND